MLKVKVRTLDQSEATSCGYFRSVDQCPVIVTSRDALRQSELLEPGRLGHPGVWRRATREKTAQTSG